jgi:hypothetical protein
MTEKSFNFSDEAESAKGLFYDKEKMLFVEGDDDATFWEIIFEKNNRFDVQIESVGGLPELEKKISKIEAGDIKAYAARDLDFSILGANHKKIRGVFVTYGHSIENTILCKKAVLKIARIHSRSKLADNAQKELNAWVDTFNTSFEDLVVFDAINVLEKKGLTVLSGNCSKFMMSDKSITPSDLKISNHIVDKDLGNVLGGKQAEVLDRVEKSDKVISDFMRGHFLFSGYLKYTNKIISDLGSNRKVSVDTFYSNSLFAFEALFDSNHDHFTHYSNQLAEYQ